jgi:FMNH2-dependent dimethyl sulfone monooxygenase
MVPNRATMTGTPTERRLGAGPERMRMYGDHRFRLGLFGANCSSAEVVTTLPDRWSGEWDDNLRLAQLAEACGLDFMLPIGRWKGYGGSTDFQGSTYETITWASGLLAATKRITVFGTVHAPLFHPVLAAKQMVTADHIGHGRFGLNVVCGWNEGEFDMFGVKGREHDARYAFGQEWLDAILAIWSGDDFDFQSDNFDLRGLRVKPKPYGGTRPLLMNAGQSASGQAFALRNCDALFTAMRFVTDAGQISSAVAALKAGARQIGRDVDVYTTCFVVCRPTRQEAEETLRYHVDENCDWGAIEGFLRLKGELGRPPAELEKLRRAYPRGVLGYVILGTPDEVTEKLAELSTAGLAGTGMSMIHYADELPYFHAEVLPRLERLGLRRPVALAEGVAP